MKYQFAIVLALFLSDSLLADEGLSPTERRFHNIYQKYNSRPTSEEVWEAALTKRESQEYVIVKGDTLWDISRTLFGDGFFWSKVWSLNPFITNPHQISVGQVIHFYPGQGLEAPGLIVDKTSKAPALTMNTPLLNTKWWLSQDLPPVPVDLAGVVLPPPSRHSKVLDGFPDSLPNWYFQTDSSQNGLPLEIIPIEQHSIINILSLPYFISEYPQAIKGTIFEIEKNAKAASERDYLFIDADEELKVGTTYTVIQKIGKIRDPEALEDYPKAYEVQGEIQIVGRVEKLYKALVTLALFPLRVGANIIPGSSPKMNLTEPGELAPMQAMIIGGENDTTRSLFGPQSIVYLNRGSADGIKVNQRAPVMAVHRLRHPDSKILSNTWRLGEIKVVKVEENYSTAVVIDATEGILPGDIVGEFKVSEISENLKKLDASTPFGDAGEDDLISGSSEDDEALDKEFEGAGASTPAGGKNDEIEDEFSGE